MRRRLRASPRQRGSPSLCPERPPRSGGWHRPPPHLGSTRHPSGPQCPPRTPSPGPASEPLGLGEDAQGGVFTGRWHDTVSVTGPWGTRGFQALHFWVFSSCPFFLSVCNLYREAVPWPRPLPLWHRWRNMHQGSWTLWVGKFGAGEPALWALHSWLLLAASPDAPQLPRPGPPTPALTAEAAPWRGRGCCSPGPCAARAAAAAPAAPTAGFPERAQPSAGPRAGPAGALLPVASGGGRGDLPPPGPTEQPQGVTKENRPLSVLQVGKPRLREAGNQRWLWDTTGGQGAPAGCSLGSPGGFYNVLTPWPHPGTTGS